MTNIYFMVQAYEGSYLPFKNKFFIKAFTAWSDNHSSYGKIDGYQSAASAKAAATKLAAKYNGEVITMDDVMEALAGWMNGLQMQEVERVEEMPVQQQEELQHCEQMATPRYTSPRYITVTDTAKIIRTELKQNFPSIKFSVKSKSYSGGASISIHWTDGPTSKAVEAIANKFEGKGATDLTDYAPYVDGELNGESVHFGSNYVFCSRHLSVEFLTAVAKAYCTRYNKNMPMISVSCGSAYIDVNYRDETGEQIVNKASATDASKLDEMFAEEDRQLAEYKARRAAQIAEVEENREMIEAAPYTIKVVEDGGDTKYEVWQGTIYEGFNYTRIDSEITILRLIKENQAYHVEPEQEPAQTLVTIIEELPHEEKITRVLLSDGTIVRVHVRGELKLHLKRHNARLVDAQTFEDEFLKRAEIASNIPFFA